MFDSNGEIYGMYEASSYNRPSNAERKNFGTSGVKLYPTEILWENWREGLEIPERLTGEVTGITAYKWVDAGHDVQDMIEEAIGVNQ